MAGQPIHIELGVPDVPTALAFYGALFGWAGRGMPSGSYVQTPTLDIGMHGGDPLSHHEVFYAVDDLDAAMARLAGLGGRLVGEVRDSPGFGRWTEAADDQGAPFGLVEKAPAEPAPPPPTVWPTLMAADAPAMIEWLVGAFGFLVTERVEEDGLVRHAELAWPEGGGIMLSSIRPGADRRPGAFDAYLVTASPDAVHARAVGHGAVTTVELHDTSYGSRAFTVTDPEGNGWHVGTYRGAPVPG